MAVDEGIGSNKARRHMGPASGLMLVTTFCWASNIVAGKEALRGFNSLTLAQLQMSGAAILYVLLYIAWRGFPSLRLTKRQWLALALMALTCITLNQICYIGGLARTSVTHTGLIQVIGPVMVLIEFIRRVAPYEDRAAMAYQVMPKSLRLSCGAVSPSDLLIGPDGELYKCMTDFGVADMSHGHIEDLLEHMRRTSPFKILPSVVRRADCRL